MVIQTRCMTSDSSQTCRKSRPLDFAGKTLGQAKQPQLGDLGDLGDGSGSGLGSTSIDSMDWFKGESTGNPWGFYHQINGVSG